MLDRREIGQVYLETDRGERKAKGVQSTLPTANLDDHRRDNLAGQILKIKGFSQLFVISHDDNFERDTDNVVRVVKENGVSRAVVP